MLFSATIYAKCGDNQRPGGRVGITFRPTPSLTAAELRQLITDLQGLLTDMEEM